MTSANEKFLDAYRDLDTELKMDGLSVLDYENTLDETRREKLKLCRIMRNYMSHNDTTFATASSDQTKFLEGLTIDIRRKSHTVKDEMKKVPVLKATAPIKEVIAILAKYPVAVMDTKTGLYLVDKDNLIKQLASGNKKIAIPVKIPKYKYLNKDKRISDIGSGVYIVTSDGTENGKYLGIIKM